MTNFKTPRPGELQANADRIAQADDARLIFIGKAATPWRRGDCPKTMVEARARGKAASLLIDAAWRAAMRDVERASHLILLGWFGDSDRTLLLQTPAHSSRPTGTFALRSPARANPIGLSIVRVIAVDHAAGRIEIDALDWFDATPLLDVKPYFVSIDSHPDATVAKI
jgi:tRNA-Thr(GGU) m(6)t(6)A37 methyltransferase TsaA